MQIMAPDELNIDGEYNAERDDDGKWLDDSGSVADSAGVCQFDV